MDRLRFVGAIPRDRPLGNWAHTHALCMVQNLIDGEAHRTPMNFAKQSHRHPPAHGPCNHRSTDLESTKTRSGADPQTRRF